MTEKESLKIGQGKPGPGRPKGKPNKSTTALKDAILEAARLHGLDGTGKDGLTGYLLHVATDDVKAFASLLGRVLPLDVNATGSLTITIAARDADL